MRIVSEATRRVTAHMESLWDFRYQPSERELDILYRISKRNQWDAAAVVDWDRPLAACGPQLGVTTYGGAHFVGELAPEVRDELDLRVSAWRLSQFLHGEQAALLICGQLINALPDLDAKLFSATQAIDEGRHVEAFERYVKRLHTIYPPDPLLRNIVDYMLASPDFHVKLVGMQVILEGMALGSFHVVRKQSGEPLLVQLLEYILQDEGRHFNFGVRLLKKSLPALDEQTREQLVEFGWTTCDALFGRGLGGFGSISTVWEEMGLDKTAVSRDIAAHAGAAKAFNTVVFAKTLVPKMERVGLISGRARLMYERSGLIPSAP
jgi:hypothetical protein